jgi:hypothetical protein
MVILANIERQFARKVKGLADQFDGNTFVGVD